MRATYLTSGHLSDVDVVGDYALLGNTNGTVVLLQISDPTDPIAVSTNIVAGGVTAVRLVGADAYVRTATGGLVILPLLGPTPTAPALQAAVSAQLAAAGQTAVMSVRVSGTPPLSFQWRKNGVVLTNDARISGTTNAWLVISNSVLADTGNYAVTVSNALGQLVSSNGLTVVNPGAPVLRGEFHPGGSAQSIAVKDFAAYVAAGTNGLEIFSVVNPQLPYRIGGNDVVGFSSGVQVAGATAYVATGSEGLQLFNITSLPVAAQVAATNTAGTARGIYLAGGWIYVADGENGLQIFSYNGAAPPAFVAGTNTPGFAWNVAVADGVAYVADGTNGLQIFSVTNAATLAQIGTYDTPGEARNVRVFAGKAYVADGAAGLVVLDVSNPASPSLLGVMRVRRRRWTSNWRRTLWWSRAVATGWSRWMFPCPRASLRGAFLRLIPPTESGWKVIGSMWRQGPMVCGFWSWSGSGDEPLAIDFVPSDIVVWPAPPRSSRWPPARHR